MKPPRGLPGQGYHPPQIIGAGALLGISQPYAQAFNNPKTRESEPSMELLMAVRDDAEAPDVMKRIFTVRSGSLIFLANAEYEPSLR